MRPKGTDLARERKDLAGTLFRAGEDDDKIVSALMKTGMLRPAAEAYYKKFKRSKGMRESKFEMYLESLKEGRGNPLEKEQYKVKYDKEQGWYTIVGGGQTTHRGIESKEKAEKLCAKLNEG